MMKQIITEDNFEEACIADRRLEGMEVFGKDGELVGILSCIYLNPEDMGIEFIKVKGHKFFSDMVFSKKQIDNITSQKLYLSIIPAQDVSGKVLYDVSEEKEAYVKMFSDDRDEKNVLFPIMDSVRKEKFRAKNEETKIKADGSDDEQEPDKDE